MTAIDWTEIFKKYKGMWVALLDDEVTVVGSGKTLREAKDMAKAKGYENPIMTQMPDELVTYIGGFQSV